MQSQAAVRRPRGLPSCGWCGGSWRCPLSLGFCVNVGSSSPPPPHHCPILTRTAGWKKAHFKEALIAQLVKNPPAMQETVVRFLGREDPLKGQAIHSSTPGLPLWLSWYRICLQCGRPGFDPWVEKIPWRRERLPTPVFWPGESHGLYSS